jgi:rare lipoprotein A
MLTTHARRLVALCAHWMAAGIMASVPMLGALLAVSVLGTEAEAKTPGKTYCFYSKCHRVKTIAETEASVGSEETVSASFYDSCKKDSYNPCGLTSSGEEFRPEATDNVASPIYPDGTTLLLWSPATGASAVVRVNNAGPYWGNRTLDVSAATADVLGFSGEGVGTLKLRVLSAPTQEEATYKERRTYAPVPGYIGQFASLDAAQSGAVTAYAVAGLSNPGQGSAPAVVAQIAGLVGSPSGPTLTREMAVAMLPKEEPVKVAAIEWPVVHETPKKAPVVLASAEAQSTQPVRARSKAERQALRNSRSYRLAAAKQQKAQRAKTVVASAEPVAKGPRPVTMDGTNDMSVFSRHTYAGVERLAADEAPSRTRRQTASLMRSRTDG